MVNYAHLNDVYDDYLEHYGVKGMEWGKKKKPAYEKARNQAIRDDFQKGLASGANSPATDYIKQAVDKSGAFRKVYTTGHYYPYYYKSASDPKENEAQRNKVSPEVTKAVLDSAKAGLAKHGRQQISKIRRKKIYSSGESAIEKMNKKLSTSISSIFEKKRNKRPTQGG